MNSVQELKQAKATYKNIQAAIEESAEIKASHENNPWGFRQYKKPKLNLSQEEVQKIQRT